jgi:mannose-6-phosphate isomerase-like protein (cupin superfamily)
MKGTVISERRIPEVEVRSGVRVKRVMTPDTCKTTRMHVLTERIDAGRDSGALAYARPYDVAYVVLAGRATVRAGGQAFEAADEEIVFVPAGLEHTIDNRATAAGGEPLTIVSIFPRTPGPGRDVPAAGDPDRSAVATNGRGATFVPTRRVKQYVSAPAYTSRMVLDRLMSASELLQLNLGLVTPGMGLKGGVHRPPYDEGYVILKGDGILNMACEDGTDRNAMHPGDMAFIPGGTFHRIENTNPDHPIVLMTIWADHPEEGVNGNYDNRIKEWGRTYVLVDEA